MAEMKTLNECNAELTTALSLEPSIIASELLAKNLIPSSIMDEMLLSAITPRQKASKLIVAVRSAVELNPENYKVFVDVLEKEPSRKDIVKILAAAYQTNVKQLENESIRQRRKPKGGIQNAADDGSNTDLPTPIATQHPQGQSKSVCSPVVFCIALVLIGVSITMTVYLWKPRIDRALSLSKDVPATNVWSKDPDEDSTKTELPSLGPNVNVNKVCHKIIHTDDFAELAEIISIHGDVKKWCHLLGISNNCNQFDSHWHQISYDVASAYLAETLELCWEDIVRVLCKELKKNKAAFKLAEKHSVNYSSQCG